MKERDPPFAFFYSEFQVVTAPGMLYLLHGSVPLIWKGRVI